MWYILYNFRFYYMYKCTIFSLVTNIQCNLSIPNLAYSEILLNPNKLFGPKVFSHFLHMKLPCVF